MCLLAASAAVVVKGRYVCVVCTLTSATIGAAKTKRLLCCVGSGGSYHHSVHTECLEGNMAEVKGVVSGECSTCGCW